MTTLYLAGPLFSAAEKAFNTALATAITKRGPRISVILPQERALRFLGRSDQNEAIFQDCLQGVREADVIAAILEGADVDSGTAVELGYALALQKRVVGIRSDFRISEERGLNVMVAFACTWLVIDPRAGIEEVAACIVEFCEAGE